MNKGIEIRAVDREELEEVCRIEKESFADAWSMDNILEFYNNEYDYINILKADKELLGFIIFRIIGAEAEVMRIAVAKKYRHNCLGHILLQDMIAFCIVRYVENVFLEVRKSNIAAIKLYEKSEFIELGIRKDYYSNPVEDAIIYARKIEGV